MSVRHCNRCWRCCQRLTFALFVCVWVCVRVLCFAKKVRALKFPLCSFLSLLNISMSLKWTNSQIECKELNTDYQNEKDIYSLDIVAAADVGCWKKESNGGEWYYIWFIRNFVVIRLVGVLNTCRFWFLHVRIICRRNESIAKWWCEFLKK